MSSPAKSSARLSRAEIVEALSQALQLPDAARAVASVAVTFMSDRDVDRLSQAAEAIVTKAIDCIERKDFDGLKRALREANVPASLIEVVMARVRSPRHHGQ